MASPLTCAITTFFNSISLDAWGVISHTLFVLFISHGLILSQFDDVFTRYINP